MILTPNRLWNISKVCVMQDKLWKSLSQGLTNNPLCFEAMSMLIDVSRIDDLRTQNRINSSRTNVSKVDVEESKEYNQEI
jgi:hypothetical protein